MLTDFISFSAVSRRSRLIPFIFVIFRHFLTFLFSFDTGLLKQWQEILQMIVKRLQLSEAFGKIMKDVESMESNLESVALPQDNPQQLFHSQQDLENHIQTLKVREIILNISPHLL